MTAEEVINMMDRDCQDKKEQKDCYFFILSILLITSSAVIKGEPQN